jgi:hypothetical protein
MRYKALHATGHSYEHIKQVVGAKGNGLNSERPSKLREHAAAAARAEASEAAADPPCPTTAMRAPNPPPPCPNDPPSPCAPHHAEGAGLRVVDGGCAPGHKPDEAQRLVVKMGSSLQPRQTVTGAPCEALLEGRGWDLDLKATL